MQTLVSKTFQTAKLSQHILPNAVTHFQQSSASTSAGLKTSTGVNFKGVIDVGIKPDSLNIQSRSQRYPTLGNGGVSYLANIGNVSWSSKHVAQLQNYIWKNPEVSGAKMDFLPKQPVQPLTGELAVISDLANTMAVQLEGGQQGLLAKNQLRKAVMALDVSLIDATQSLISGFKQARSVEAQREQAQEIQSLSVYAQWLVRGFLFEGVLHGEPTISPVVPSPLSVISAMANQATGLQQKEFVYHSYTLLPATLPDRVGSDVMNLDTLDFDTLDYDNPNEILHAIAMIKTDCGFNDAVGGLPEHNFRFNHVLMEYQMRQVFSGYQKVKSGDLSGFDDMIEGYRRAHKVFETMLVNTPAATYPDVRLPIQAVEGRTGVAERLSVYPARMASEIVFKGLEKMLKGEAGGQALLMEGVKRADQQLASWFQTSPFFEGQQSLYPPEGVLYEGLGDATLMDAYTGQQYFGERPPMVPGQTGANSSMYKLADVFIKVAELRSAYENEPAYFEKLSKVLLKELPYTELGSDPIDSMMRAFDVLTRPDVHQQTLIETYEEVSSLAVFNQPTTEIKVKLLQISYWVAKHRLRHGEYVNKAIFSVPPKANQSRAEGTGGSTIQFLKRFFDDTLTPAHRLIAELKVDKTLNDQDRSLVLSIEQDLQRQQQKMTAVNQKGLDLLRQEGKNEQASVSVERSS